VVSFALFARDQMAGASHGQQLALATSATPAPAPVPGSAPTTASAHKSLVPRDVIDDVTGWLTSPFASVVSSDNAWVKRGVPTVIALLFYGLGLSWLARYTRSSGI
jgi:hypothetical protein